MTLDIGAFRRRFGQARKPSANSERSSPQSGGALGLHDLARDLGDRAACPPALLEALAGEIGARRSRNGMHVGPASPRVTGLLVRRTGLPDWWAAGDNLLLAAADTDIPQLRLNPYKPPATGVVIVLGSRVSLNHLNVGGEGALIVLGDRVYCAAGAVSCLHDSTVLIGEGTSATNWAMIDACNGGIILTGEDGMWAHGVSLMTDDTHAIRDAKTGRRLNVRGGRIMIDRHVWLGENARVWGGARVGHDCVVGAGALVKSAEIPAHSVCVGVPARVVRSAITWSREDAP